MALDYRPMQTLLDAGACTLDHACTHTRIHARTRAQTHQEHRHRTHETHRIFIRITHMAGLRDLSAQAAGTCPGTGLLSGAHEGGVEQGACASGVVQQGKEKQEKHRELQATVPTDLRDDAMHATGLFFLLLRQDGSRGGFASPWVLYYMYYMCVCVASKRPTRQKCSPSQKWYHAMLVWFDAEHTADVPEIHIVLYCTERTAACQKCMLYDIVLH